MKLKNESILVTGGAGFVGSSLVDRLLNLNNFVVVYDNFDEFYNGKEKNIERFTVNDSFLLHKSDILDFEQLSSAMKDVNVVFHLAAQPGVRFSAKNPWKTNAINVEGTMNVLLAAVKNKVKKVVFSSSSSVYGTPKQLPCDEKQPTLPVSIYGASKLAGENYCQTFFRNFKLPVAILRYHTVYGPGQRPDMAIHKFAKSMLEGRSPIVFGDGRQTRDFTYISDVVDGTIRAAESENSSGEVFNIGSGSQVTINYVIKLLSDIIDVDSEPEYQPRKPDDVEHTFADISKASDILGYRPKMRFQEGLENFVEWLKKRYE